MVAFSPSNRTRLADDHVARLAYDSRHNLTYAIDAKGTEVMPSYDALNRRVKARRDPTPAGLLEAATLVGDRPRVRATSTSSLVPRMRVASEVQLNFEFRLLVTL